MPTITGVVMDLFYVIRLAAEALDKCRQRARRETTGRRGRSGDPLHQARRTLLTGTDILADKQSKRIKYLFAIEAHVEVEATWSIYQRVVQTWRCPDKISDGF